MKLYNVVLVLCCITVTYCLECKKTGCEGITKSGDALCKQYGYGHYTGQTSSEGCGWDTNRAICCEKTLSKPECKWSTSCYGVSYGSAYVCKREFGSEFRPSEVKIGCSGLGMTAFECCP